MLSKISFINKIKYLLIFKICSDNFQIFYIFFQNDKIFFPKNNNKLYIFWKLSWLILFDITRKPVVDWFDLKVYDMVNSKLISIKIIIKK